MPWDGILFIFGGMFVLLCCGGVLLIRTLLIVITVRGESMEPALGPGDRVLAMRPIWPIRVQKGQIVLFRQALYDEEVGDPALSLHIKRVVALAGETYCSSPSPLGYNEHVTREGQSSIWHIPQNHIFVCGDNLEQSVDSRSWGPLPLRHLRGIVVRQLAPSPASLSAQITPTQRSIGDEKPDRFHVESH